MTDASIGAAPRWIPLAGTIVGMVGLAIVIVGALIAVGVWRGEVDKHLADIDRRLETAESNQRTYIPILVGMTKDVSYLAERARRQDDREHR